MLQTLGTVYLCLKGISRYHLEKELLLVYWTNVNKKFKTGHKPCLYDKELLALYLAFNSPTDSQNSVDN